MRKIQIEEKYKTLMEAWIEDLREHPELQGKDTLYDNHNNTFCCLGRLCIVAGMEKECIVDDVHIEPFMDEFADVSISKIADFDDLPFLAMNDGFVTRKRFKEAQESWGKDVIKREKGHTFPEIANFLEQRIEYI